MNKERVLRVADAIERAEFAPEFGFNMSYVELQRSGPLSFIPDQTGHNCGSVGCIAGWAMRLSGEEIKYSHSFDEAREWLMLQSITAEQLFVPPGTCWHNITTAQAVWTLRHLAETGEVVWQDRVTSDARKICRAFDAAEERESTEVGI